ncbi:MAG: zinc ribbon domain-containing protein [Bradymonadales bacterium]|nr:zinc ribbon domain-containing protein [Bradymonadales bacterium]
MPIYEYRCLRCGDKFEELLRAGDPDPVCPLCGAEKPRRLISNTYFSLKGTGWYATDYGARSRQTGRAAEERPKEQSDSSDSSAESKSISSDQGGKGTSGVEKNPSGGG